MDNVLTWKDKMTLHLFSTSSVSSSFQEEIQIWGIKRLC